MLVDLRSEIISEDNPILRKKAEEVRFQQGVVIGLFLIKILKKCREDLGLGVGLSAPQIGESKAVFVTCIEGVYKMYIIPRIIKKSKELNMCTDVCLSCLNHVSDVKRSKKITLEYTDEYGNFNIIDAQGAFAGIVQHELDHLNGIVRVDIAA